MNAPPAHTLPLWEREEINSTSKSEQLLQKEIEDWVHASTPTAEKKEVKPTKEMDNTFTASENKEEKTPDLLNHSWPLPKTNLEKKIDLNIMTGRCHQNNPVETFFKSFRHTHRSTFTGNYYGHNPTKHVATKLLYKKKTVSSQSYSYF